MAERVADYPRPPALVSSDATIEIAALGVVICSTSRSLRVLETFHPPTYYLPPDSMRTDLLVRVGPQLLRMERNRDVLGSVGW